MNILVCVCVCFVVVVMKSYDLESFFFSGMSEVQLALCLST